MDKLHKEYIDAHEKLREKLRKEGLNEDRVEIKMNKIALDFFKLAWLNGADFTKGSKTERAKRYIDYLKDELKN